jgi:hypothetical protein
LCELDLELTFARARVRRKNVQNQLRSVNHSATDSFLNVAPLYGRQIVIDNDEWNTAGLGFNTDFVEFSPADKCGGVWSVADL